MRTTEQYVAPELKLVGETDNLVFGLTQVGDDYAGEIYIPEMDFETD
ncbi:MAG TPA: hypothetical protein VEU96_06870 [Bryobacteraceae bacterium]|nr:hypothetical protein [Bryobacteraceae bacterium]